ncbi:SpoIIE family protein phosphatase [Streptomyces sp. NPDC089424]|uniref:SpoIIE family protein phosphatase n=1 Tax=Streptomyces sp. NPDC089424 TaxID=3365917 RepID=UPI00381C4741
MHTSDVSDTAFALIDEQGTVMAWTQAAEALVGRSAREVVGRSAEFVLPCFSTGQTMTSYVEQCRGRNGWSGAPSMRHRDGRSLTVGLRVSLVRGHDRTVCWLVSATDIAVPSADAVNVLVQGAILDRAPIGVVVRDLRLRCTWVNDTMESHDGISRVQRLGRRVTDAWTGVEAETLEAVMRQVLQSGSIRVHEYRTWLPTRQGDERPCAVSISCLQGADGKALGVCMISADLTESRLERERLTILGQAGMRLGSTLDVMQTGQELADLAVPQFADYVSVDVEQSVQFGEGPPVRIGSVGERLPVLLRAGVASIHPGIPESPWKRGERILLPHTSPVAEVLRSGKSRLEPKVDTVPGGWIDQSPALAQRIRENGIHSVMVVPIQARRVLLGMAVFIRTENPRPFQEADLLLAEELVSRAAGSLDQARQYCREQTAALALQRSLLPHRLRGGAAVDAVSRYLPSEIDRGVGGDWFDVIPLSGARVALVVGDVVGHGINAAAAMGRLRTAVHTLADMELPPDELLARLDDTVQRLAEADADAPDEYTPVMGATCLYAVYDPATCRCTMAAAGHPPPAIIDPRGKVSFPDLPTGVPLGIGAGALFESTELELPEGTLVALYTDGMIETRDRDIEHGMRSLGTALASTDLSLEELCTRATALVQDQEASDDASLLLVRTRSLSPAQVATWNLPRDDTAVHRAQELTAGQLSAWGLDGSKSAIELIVGELVTNADRQGDGAIRLRLIHHQFLTVEVTDAEADSPPRLDARTTDGHGSGLAKVARISRRWGTRPSQDGKVLWAEADLAPASGR